MVVGMGGERGTGHHPDGGDSGRSENCGSTLHVHGPFTLEARQKALSRALC